MYSSARSTRYYRFYSCIGPLAYDEFFYHQWISLYFHILSCFYALQSEAPSHTESFFFSQAAINITRLVSYNTWYDYSMHLRYGVKTAPEPVLLHTSLHLSFRFAWLKSTTYSSALLATSTELRNFSLNTIWSFQTISSLDLHREPTC